MSNIDIVKTAIKKSNYFNNDVVSHISTESEVNIITKKIFIRNSELNKLKVIIEELGGSVYDIFISSMPSLNYDLCVEVQFN